jgi:hypothetical protein
MSLQIKGRLIKKLESQSGTNKAGTVWIKKDFIIETIEQYPKSICVSAWGDKSDIIEYAQIGDEFSISVIIESREYNGKWYTDLKVWNISKTSAAKVPDETKHAYTQADLEDEDQSDLPF